jgi:hypothetical protein
LVGVAHRVARGTAILTRLARIAVSTVESDVTPVGFGQQLGRPGGGTATGMVAGLLMLVVVVAAIAARRRADRHRADGHRADGHRSADRSPEKDVD